jgi:hypothetical protein
MRIYFENLVDLVMKERLAGKSFLEISKKCLIPDPNFIKLVYTWKNLQEPISWKREHLDLELARAEALYSAYWLDAASGDRKAASILLKANNLRMALIEKIADFPEGRIDELTGMMIESEEGLKKIEALLRSQIEKYNDLTKDIDYPNH